MFRARTPQNTRRGDITWWLNQQTLLPLLAGHLRQMIPPPSSIWLLTLGQVVRSPQGADLAGTLGAVSPGEHLARPNVQAAAPTTETAPAHQHHIPPGQPSPSELSPSDETGVPWGVLLSGFWANTLVSILPAPQGSRGDADGAAWPPRRLLPAQASCSVNAGGHK